MVFYGWKVGEWTEWTAERGVFWGMVVVEVEVVVVKVCQWFGWRRWRWGTLNTKHKTHKTVSFSQRDTARKVAETERESREKSLCVNFNFFFFFCSGPLESNAVVKAMHACWHSKGEMKRSNVCVWQVKRTTKKTIDNYDCEHLTWETDEWVGEHLPAIHRVHLFLVEVQAGRWTANVAQTKHFPICFVTLGMLWKVKVCWEKQEKRSGVLVDEAAVSV